jgi:hypothetical protein
MLRPIVRPFVTSSPPPRGRTGRNRTSRHFLGITSWLVVAAFLATSLLAFIPSGESAQSDFLDSAADGPSAPAASVRGRELVGRRLVISWPVGAGVAAYKVILVRGDERIDRWVSRASLEVGGIPAGHPETYTWYVYPAFTVPGGHRFGALLAKGSITVESGTIPAARRGLNL